MFPEFVASSGYPIAQGCLTYAALIRSVYTNTPLRLDDWLAYLAPATLGLYKWDLSLTRPDVAVFRGPKEWLIALDGSTTWQQVFSVIVGAGISTGGQNLRKRHAWADDKFKEILALMPKQLTSLANSDTVTITGHSLGGMVAVYLAEQIRLYTHATVRLLVFATPKTHVGTESIYTPPYTMNLALDGDPAPHYPPTVVLLPGLTGLRRLIPPVAKLMRDHWEQVPPLYGLTQSGDAWLRYATDYFDSIANFRTFSTATTAARHALTFYIAQLIAKCIAEDPAFVDSPLYALVQKVLADADPHTGSAEHSARDYVNPDVLNPYQYPNKPPQITPATVPNLRSFVVTFADAKRDPTRNIGVERQDNMASPSGLWKITLIFNAKDVGRSESHVLKETRGFTFAKKAALDLAFYRSTLLGNTASSKPNNRQTLDSPQIEFVRMADALNPRNSVLIDLSASLDYFGFSGSTDWGCDTLSTALSFRLQGLNQTDLVTTSYATLDIVGQPDSIVKNRKYNGSPLNSVGNSFDKTMRDYLSFLTGTSAPLFGYVGLSSLEAKQTIEGFALDNTNKWVLTVPGHGYLTGDKVRLTHCDVKGFANTYTVKAATVDTLNITTQPPTDLRVPTQGKVQRIAQSTGLRTLQFYQYSSLGTIVTSELVSIRKKNVGRPFFKQSFRRRARRVV